MSDRGPADARALLAAVTEWGHRRPDVHAVLLVGSYARVELPADRWSDVDLVLVVDDPAAYASSADWVAAFGEPLLTFLEPTAVGGSVERRVLFATGLDADFALFPRPAAESAPEQAGVAATLARGFRVLVDKLDLEPALRRAASQPAPPLLPTPAAFAQLTHDFWYHALWAAKKLRRGEVWIAKQTCDGYLKNLLIDLLAWHARARNPDTDTWHDGRFLEHWADPDALHNLRPAYARYDPTDVARALRATVDLFERIERDCATQFAVPLSVPHARVRQQLIEILAPGASD